MMMSRLFYCQIHGQHVGPVCYQCTDALDPESAKLQSQFVQVVDTYMNAPNVGTVPIDTLINLMTCNENYIRLVIRQKDALERNLMRVRLGRIIKNAINAWIDSQQPIEDLEPPCRVNSQSR